MLLTKCKNIFPISQARRTPLLSNQIQFSGCRFAHSELKNYVSVADMLKTIPGVKSVGEEDTKVQSGEDIAEKRRIRLLVDQNITKLPRPVLTEKGEEAAPKTIPIRPIKADKCVQHGVKFAKKLRKNNFAGGVVFGDGPKVAVQIYKDEILRYIASPIGFLGHTYKLEYSDGTSELVFPQQIQRALNGNPVNVTFFRKTAKNKQTERLANKKAQEEKQKENAQKKQKEEDLRKAADLRKWMLANN